MKYCPFCRESFEQETTCPVHDLALVSEAELPPDADEEDVFDQRVDFYALHYGRGLVHLSWLTMLVGFALPFVGARREDEFVVRSAIDLAIMEAPNLWVISMIAVSLIAILAVRRTPRQMRGARLAIPVISLLPAAPLAYSLYRVHYMADFAGIGVSIEEGPYVIASGMLLGIAGGFRFGGPPPLERLPHGARPDGPSSINLR